MNKIVSIKQRTSNADIGVLERVRHLLLEIKARADEIEAGRAFPSAGSATAVAAA